jgi:RNA polymerase sigma factor (TIGR02999 family)
MNPSSADITTLLQAWRQGDDDALNRLVSDLYGELHRMAQRRLRNERDDHTLQTTALVNEAYLRLVNAQEVDWQNRTHFFAVAAQIMRRILVDHARTHHYQKRGGGAEHLPLLDPLIGGVERSRDMIALDDALTALAQIDSRKARVVELRFFAGLGVEEIAEVLDVSSDTVMRDWKLARAWLVRELGTANSGTVA